VAALAGLVVVLAAAAPGAEVPPPFREVYRELAERLARFDATLSVPPATSARPVVFAAELLPANGNRGEALLAPRSYDGAVMYLDRLQDLGVGGVTLQLPYPLLSEGFPRADDYWAFYRRLAAEVRRRGLKLLVKNGPVFTEPEVSPVRPDYSRVSWDDYFTARSRIARRAEAEVSPDYLSIGNEPSTEMKVLGKTGLTEERYARFVADTLAALPRARKTLVGAGAGNWDAPGYVRAFARNRSLDYVDIHVYPLGTRTADYLARAAEMAAIARGAGKRLVIGECWLYKAGAADLAGQLSPVEMFGRDTFGFWAPLDQQMLRVVARFAAANGVEYVSPFWSKYFFAYLDYDEHRTDAPGARLAAADREAAAAILARRVSPTGRAYADLIAR